MENLEDIASTGRVTRSLRKRLTSVDSSDTASRPTTPLPQKLTSISELNSPSRPARMTRRNSTTGASTPAKSRTSVLVESIVDAAGTPARRSTRKRSLSISEDTPSKVGGKPNVAQPKFDTLTEEDTKSSADVPNSQKRVTRGQSKSPLQPELEKTTSSSSKAQRAYKPAPKSKMLRRQINDSDSDVEITNLSDANEDVKKSVKNEKSIEEKPSQKHIESPKLRTEQMVKASVQSPKTSPLKKSIREAGDVSLSKTDEQQSEIIELLDDTVSAEENQTLLNIKTEVDPTEELNKKDTSIDHVKQTPDRYSNDIETKETSSKDATITTPKQCATKSPVKVVEVVRLCRMSPHTMVMLASSSLDPSPGKSKSVTFNDSDVDDSVLKGAYPRTPYLAKSKSYIDIYSSKEVDDRSFQSDKASVASFKDANEQPESGRSSRTDAADHSKESLEYHDATNGHEEEEHIDDIDALLLENKTPHKSKLLLEHTSSTPVVESEAKNEQMLKRVSMETAVEEKGADEDTDLLDKSLRSGKKYGDSPNSAQKSVKKLNKSESEDTTPKKAMSTIVNSLSDNQNEEQNISVPIFEANQAIDDKKVTSTIEELDVDSTEKATPKAAESSFATSWSQGVSGKANNSKIDTISTESTPNKIASERTPETKAKNAVKQEEVDAIKEDAESEEEKEPSYEKIWFVDDEAIEANEGYCSGDSLTAEERQEIEENKIEVDGDSIGSVDTMESMADEESDNEVASFVTSDSEDEVLLEYSDDDEHLEDEPKPTTKSYKRIQTISNSSNDAMTEVDAKKVNGHKALNGSGDGAALTLDVSKMIDETLNGEELTKASGNRETKKRRSSTGNSIKTALVDERIGEAVDLNNSTKEKRKSLNKSTSEASEHNKSAEKIATDNSSAKKAKNRSTASDITLMSEQSDNIEVADDVLSKKIADELRSSSAMKDFIDSGDMDVIVVKRTSIEGKQSQSIKKTEHTRRSGYAASKAAVTSSSADEYEIQHKSLNGSQKMNGSNGKKAQRKAVISSSSSSDEEEDDLPFCQSLQMQRAEVHESSDEDEVVGNSLHSSGKGSSDSLNKSKPNGVDSSADATEGISASAEQNCRKSLNSSQQTNAKSSQMDRRLSKSLQETVLNSNNNNSRSSDNDVGQVSARKSLRKQRAEVYEFSDEEDESEYAKLEESNKDKSFGNGKNAEKLVQSTKSPTGRQRTSIQNDVKSVNKHNLQGEVKEVDAVDSNKHNTKLSSHERSIAVANADDTEDSAEESDSDADEKPKSMQRSSQNMSQKVTTESSTESEGSEDSDNEDNDEEEANSVQKPTKAAAGLSVSFGQIKKDKTKDVLCGKIKHSSFTIGVTVKKNASNVPQPSTSTEAGEDSIEQPSSTDNKDKPLSSDEEQHLEMLARTERASNIAASKRRQSLALSQTVGGSPLSKKAKRKSLCHTEDEIRRSQSFIESIDERKRALQQEKAAKRRHLSQSFCEATVAVGDQCNELVESSIARKENINATTVEIGDIDEHATGEIISTSTPRGDKAVKAGRKRTEDILSRCDEILEAANQAKLEVKRNYQKSKISLNKKNKVPKEENVAEEFVPSLSKKMNQTKTQEKTKKALEQALKASANILLNPKKDNLIAQIDKKLSETKRLPTQLLEAVANTEPRSFKNRNKDSPLKYDNGNTSHSTHKVKSTSGYLIEEALTPPGKKRAQINKFELPSGVVYEEPLTPTRKKVVSGFRESPVTPRTIGFKVRRILTAGQDMPPTMPTQQSRKERKRKRTIDEPKLTLPKPKWTQSGEFLEEELLPTARKVSRAGATEFLVSALSGARKEKAQKFTAATACSNALNFKKIAMQRGNAPRESSHEVMLRKQRQRMHSNF